MAIAVIVALAVPGTPGQPADPPPAPAGGGLREVFPGVRADVRAKLVEFDGEVPIDCHDPKTPLVYLEVLVCTLDTKEHEALVVTRVKPSNVHAALLACGMEPGKPGSWTWNAPEKRLETHAPTGSPLDVFIAYTDESGKEIEARASDWVVSADGAKRLRPKEEGGWVFAGSKIAERGGREVYDADGTGTLVGLATFGAETIAWRDVISHESAVQEPEWVADAKRVPKAGTRVVVRVRPAAIAPPPGG